MRAALSKLAAGSRFDGTRGCSVDLAKAQAVWNHIGQRRGWELLRTQQKAERVFRLQWRNDRDEVVDTIFKSVGLQETVWYSQLMLCWGNQYTVIPVDVGIIPMPYVLLPDLGASLKERLKSLDVADREEKLKAVVRQLAQMHVDTRTPVQEWLKQGKIQEYSIASSSAWEQTAIAEMWRLADQGWIGARNWASKICMQSEAVLSQLATWTNRPGLLTLIHGDPHLGNWMTTANGDVRLIDWEYLSMGAPARDVTILLQDVWEPPLQDALFLIWQDILRNGGWPVDSKEFMRTFHAARFDNTLMMLGFELAAFQRGGITREEMEHIWEIKTGWIDDDFEALMRYL